MLEILAPCGNLDSFYAAINNGANAVYLGLDKFNARYKAENFNESNIKDVVSFAHLNNCKVYLTVNTILKNNEIEDFLKLIKLAVESKIDAFIIQDLGVLNLIKSNVKNAVLHASTQLGIHNLYGAQVAEKLGFSRVVLSREATIEDIKQIKQNTNLEIEYFVQGALCVAFSGNCYLSAFLKGQSGNRGRCLQPCRLKYMATCKNKNSKSGYLLSTRDLSLAKNIKELIYAGVTSFKIEGRLRRSGYVAIATKVYSNILEDIKNNKDNANYYVKLLKQAFSRGEYNYNAYLNNEKFNIINTENQNHIGVKIGKVVSVKPFKNLYKVGIETLETLNANDGLKFFENGKEVASVGVGNVEVQNGISYIFTKHKLQPKFQVYRILNSQLENEFLNNKKVYNVQVYGNFLVNEKPSLLLSCNGTSVKVEGTEVLQQAKTCKTEKDDIVNQLKKFNSEMFVCDYAEVLSNDVFVAKSVINALRRNGIESLKTEIIKNFEQDNLMQFNKNIVINNAYNFNCKNYVVVNELTNLKLLENYKNYNVVVALLNFSEQTLNGIIKKINILNEYLYVWLPMVARNNEVNYVIKTLENCNIKNVVSNNIWGLSLTNKFNVVAGFNHNLINGCALNVIEKLGCSDAVLSMEVGSSLINEFNEVCVYSYGTPVCMTVCHCINNTITNSTCANCTYGCNSLAIQNENNNFKIRRNKVINCYFEILFNKTVNILNKHNKNVFVDLRDVCNKEFSGLFYNEIL